MAEEQNDGGVFIGSVNLDRGPSCAERGIDRARAKLLKKTECFSRAFYVTFS
jgi:hypothetical protein